MRSYCFKLADGEGWRFMAASADRDVSLFVDKFAGIAGLRTSEEGGLRKIMFLHPDEVRGVKNGPYSFPGNTTSDKRNDGWFVYDHKGLKVWRHEYIPDVICEVCDVSLHDITITNMWHALQPIYQQAQYAGGLPLHGALFELNGKGLVIAAPGNTGKSTCFRRAPGYWKPLCDDETLVVFSKKRGYLAHPFPTWSDYLWRGSNKRWDVEYSAPLQAIFFLEQSDEDEATPIGSGQAAILINQSALQVSRKFWIRVDKEHKKTLTSRLFNNAAAMSKAIPSFRLMATLNGRFWEAIEKCLTTTAPREPLRS